jgi:hypothetical protein
MDLYVRFFGCPIGSLLLSIKYIAKKISLGVRSKILEISMLIGEKRKKIYPPLQNTPPHDFKLPIIVPMKNRLKYSSMCMLYYLSLSL